MQRKFSGEAFMSSTDATLATDTINFDRNTQEVYYNTKGTIVNKDNTLISKSGRYYVSQFQFLTAVTLILLMINHFGLHKFRSPYLWTIDNYKKNYIYTEKDFMTKKKSRHFLRKSFIKYEDRLIEGDSLYYDRNKEFASATEIKNYRLC
jgi:hypothetical protein